MKKQHSLVGVIVSILLHALVFGGIWYFISQPKPLKVKEELTHISMEMMTALLEQPQVAVASDTNTAEPITDTKAVSEPETEPEPQEVVEKVQPEPVPTPTVKPITAPTNKPIEKPKEKLKEKPKEKPKPTEKTKPQEKPKEKPKPIEKPKEKVKDLAKDKPKTKEKNEKKVAQKPLEKSNTAQKERSSIKALEKGIEAKQGIVAKALPNATQGTSLQAGNATGSANASSAKPSSSNEIQAYLAKVYRVIKQGSINSYPAREKAMRKTGVVLLSFSVSPSGQTTNVSVKRSSGNNNLDRAAVQTAEKTVLGPPPAGLPNPIQIPVHFTQ